MLILFTFPAGMAVREWLRQFLKRHHSLSIRIPQTTSIAKATAFNPQAVSQFFDKLDSLMDKKVSLIFNLQF